MFPSGRDVPIAEDLRCSIAYRLAIVAANMCATTPTPHLPPHLQEVCSLLAKSILRLHRGTTKHPGNELAHSQVSEEFSLHFIAQQSGHATPITEKHP
jgi:hypothetical protein